MSEQSTKPTRLIKRSEVLDRTALSDSTMRRRIKTGEFPKPIVMTKTRGDANLKVAWIESEVEDWIHKQIDQHRNETVMVA